MAVGWSDFKGNGHVAARMAIGCQVSGVIVMPLADLREVGQAGHWLSDKAVGWYSLLWLSG